MKKVLTKILSTLHITSFKEARWIAASAVGFMLVTAKVYWSFPTANAGLSRSDIGFLVVVAVVGLLIIFVFGWLGFSQSGGDILAESASSETEPSKLLRITKAIFASFAMALATTMIIFVAFLYIGGTELANVFFVPNFIPALYLVLAVLSFPIAYKWLR